MQQLSKANHYVPKLYLKQWAHEGRIPPYRLSVPDKRVSLWIPQSLKGSAFHQPLYTYVEGRDCCLLAARRLTAIIQWTKAA